MLLNAARLPARADEQGQLLRLREQDRSLWNRAMIQRGIQSLALAATGDTLSEYHLQAGIAACHSTAPDDAGTDWPRILALYDQLSARNASPIIALNRAVAIARVRGPRAAIKAVEAIPNARMLSGYHLLHAVRADFEMQLGRHAAASGHLRKAIELATLESERALLAKRLVECEAAREDALRRVSAEPDTMSIRNPHEPSVADGSNASHQRARTGSATIKPPPA
jgi:RNA polymerase sigma-70 factor (ECF subfamily)